MKVREQEAEGCGRTLGKMVVQPPGGV